MKRYEKHIFICENKRSKEDSRGCCFDKGGSDLKAEFKERIKQLGLKSSVRANTSGCLDACEFGASVVVYPEQIWYGRVTLDDVEEIIQEHIIKNKPVERLFIKHPGFNKDYGKG
jgi:(2Fe-2S) ferredoxin